MKLFEVTHYEVTNWIDPHFIKAVKMVDANKTCSNGYDYLDIIMKDDSRYQDDRTIDVFLKDLEKY